MKKISQSDYERALEYQQKIEDAHEKLEDAIRWFNDRRADDYVAVENALNALNDVIGEADSFRDDIASNINDYYEERSDKWRESEAGDDYALWRDEWAQTLEPLELDEPEPMSAPELDIVNIAEFPLGPND